MVAAAAEDGGEVPRWRRSNTDCVFFLVSRFTCTKGSKCEYRHCEGAQFNPRNCWYWFHGNCVNPSCTFRHPPLENLNRIKSLADPPLSYGSTSVKTAKPCYFYYNSCCTKGDNCLFLHERLTPNNVVRISSEATTFNAAVNANSVGDQMDETSKDAHTNHCQDTSCKKCHLKDVPESSNPEVDGAISIAPETSADTGENMKCLVLSDQSSGDSTMEYTGQDEYSDSSSGFDVLVDDGFSNKNDSDQPLARERDINVLHAKYDIGNPVCFDLDFYDSEYYGQSICSFDDQHGHFYVGHTEGVQEHDTETTLGHLPCSRRKLERSNSDQHDKRFFYLRNSIRSAEDVVLVRQHAQIKCTSKRRRENRKVAKGRKGRNKRCRGLLPVSGSQEIESRSTHQRQVSLIEECPQPAGCAIFRGQKKKIRRKQRHVRSARSFEHSTADFTGPKTLSQIIEEKCISKSSFSQSTACMPHDHLLK